MFTVWKSKHSIYRWSSLSIYVVYVCLGSSCPETTWLDWVYNSRYEICPFCACVLKHSENQVKFLFLLGVGLEIVFHAAIWLQLTRTSAFQWDRSWFYYCCGRLTCLCSCHLDLPVSDVHFRFKCHTFPLDKWNVDKKDELVECDNMKGFSYSKYLFTDYFGCYFFLNVSFLTSNFN